jgi:hypothetical protein
VGVEAFLCISPYDGIYPSERYADFEAEEHILATDVEATPLLWLALFRPADLRTGPVPTGPNRDGELVASGSSDGSRVPI